MIRQDLFDRAEEAVGRRGEAADSLDGLSDQTGDVAGRHHVEDLLEIVEAGFGVGGIVQLAKRAPQSIATLHEVHRKPRQAGRRPRRVRRDGLGGERPAVVAVAHRQHLVGLAIRGRQQDGGVVGLAAGRDEANPRVGDARHRGDLLGELDHRLGQVESRGVHRPGGLGLDGGDHIGVAVADHRREHTTEVIQVAVALEIPDVAAFAAIDRQRVGVHRVDIRWHHGPISGQKLSAGGHGGWIRPR